MLHSSCLLVLLLGAEKDCGLDSEYAAACRLKGQDLRNKISHSKVVTWSLIVTVKMFEKFKPWISSSVR